jgi:hypothetical protein
MLYLQKQNQMIVRFFKNLFKKFTWKKKGKKKGKRRKREKEGQDFRFYLAIPYKWNPMESMESHYAVRLVRDSRPFLFERSSSSGVRAVRCSSRPLLCKK